LRIVTSEEMRKLDSSAIKNYGIPGIVLMENAGLQVLNKITSILQGQIAGKRIAVICGKGNNGGDGMVAARHLMNMGADVKLFLLARPDEIKGDAGVNLIILQRMNAKIYLLLNEKDLHRLEISLIYSHLVIDAIYGTGFKGNTNDMVSKLISMVNDNKRTVISVDLPSGMEADTGKVFRECIKANYTVTFGLPKLGMFLEPACRFVGELTIADISLPRKLVEDATLPRQLITGDWVRSKIIKREPEAHKGDFGHVLLLGGSPGMTGALCLAALGAIRTGAGLVTAGVPRSLNPILEQKLTEVMTKPLPESDKGYIGRDALETILEMAVKADVVAIGPGMGVSPEGEVLLTELLPRLNKPVVIDADGLNLLSKIVAADKKFAAKLPKDTVLTPHPGEMARLLQVSTEEVQKERIKIAENFAASWGITLVLKGAKTIVACPDGRTYLNTTGNPGMATGGTGDVLTGMIAGLMGQKYDCRTAAALGVFLHGLAADKAVCITGEYSLTAGDIIDYLPASILEITH